MTQPALSSDLAGRRSVTTADPERASPDEPHLGVTTVEPRRSDFLGAGLLVLVLVVLVVAAFIAALPS